jgi:hypothetical protein
VLSDLHLLTAKPFLYVFNVSESQIGDDALAQKLQALVSPAPSLVLSAGLEAELSQLDPADAHELLAGYGLQKSGLESLIQLGFATLGLHTYLTAGPKETRAWTIPIGASAPEAAGVIHTDFQKGFIKAEVINFDDLIAAGSVAAVRAAGKARIEGKEYVVKDGDVIEFRFNV